ncbi:uncharacterized protein [Musca autumnalis]|uniref:uncharacterized protein n=1 Tax=Musca autumnalis TaxID=221902 RepID=UPI003CE92762
MEISIKWNICRVCLKEENSKDNEQMRPIFGGGGEGKRKLAKDIYHLSGVMMKPNDGLPDKICQKCISVLKQAIHFRKTCQESNTNLLSILERTRSASNFFKKEKSLDISSEPESDDNFFGEDDEMEDMGNKDLLPASDEENVNYKGKRKNPARKEQCELKRSQKTDRINTKTELKSKDNQEHEAKKRKIEYSDLEEDMTGMEEMEEKVDCITKITEKQNPKETTAVVDNSEENNHLDLTAEDNEEQEEDEEDNNASSSGFASKMLKVQEMIDEEESFEHNISEEQVTEEGEDSKYDNVKKASESLYCILKDDIVEEVNNSHEHDTNNEDDHIEYVSISEEVEENADSQADIDEELSEQFDDDSQNNEDNVTSTVITKEEIDFSTTSYSNDSQQNIDCEYAIDEFIIHESSATSKNADKNNFKAHQINKTSIAKKSESMDCEYEIGDFIIHKSSKSNKNITNATASNYQIKQEPKIHPSRKTTTTNRKSTYATSSSLNCEICGNSFSTRQVLNVHMKIHRQEKSHECEICFKRFITACNLQAHMRCHTGEKPFECKYCGRRFADRSSHIRHERIHTNEKPFTCESCGKSFALATTLQAHLKVHTGERPYRCEPCGKSFKLAHQLKAHKNTSLHKNMENLMENPEYVDDYCNVTKIE